MPVLRIKGGTPLRGEIYASGAKNAVLPMTAASVLISGKITLTNCPRITDAETSAEIIKALGGCAEFDKNTLTIDCSGLNLTRIPQRLCEKMRSSITFCGPLLARFGCIGFYEPGGCVLGKRPIDLHIMGFKAMGAEVVEERGKITLKGSLKGAEINLPFPSVGATQSLMAAACLAKGTTVITNPSKEPETLALTDFLNACGGKISFYENRVEIEGVEQLHSAKARVIPDRIEAATYLCAAAATRGKITIRGITLSELGIIGDVLKETSCILTEKENGIFLKAPQQLNSVNEITTAPYPGFPTDLQPQICALLSLAHGKSIVKETVFEARNRHIGELIKTGAEIAEENRSFIISGVDCLKSAGLNAYDLRGGAALVIAALAAKGTSEIHNPHHIFRGYEGLIQKITSLGGNIEIL
ncbi:MAG: UDP-N-acetylglucosamine 1-carboxyvinyltransferase [Clostridiales bacterium]|nr:UDP-N-acetylglucosamine 1-carboxyvinyltransferase [Clostridiales bacterium]